jgi:hypothetical protein
MKKVTYLALLCICGNAQGGLPLFESDDVMDITIEAPMKELVRKRLKKPDFEAIIRYTDGSGRIFSLPATLSSRGNARLEACDFPPLSIVFQGDTTAGTPFAGQHKLKVVTRCRRSKLAEAWLLQEYGIYRAYNAITDYSYRVRRSEMTFLDSSDDRWVLEMPAFIIESTNEVADRLGRVQVRPPEVRVEQFELEESTNYVLFQYLIGNTDFALKRGPSGEGCCHNGRVLAQEGSQDNWIVLPYDFDQAGMIRTDYAVPDDRLGIRDVTRRLYRGFCWQNDSLPEAVSRFNKSRPALGDIIIPDEISAGRQKKMRRYIDAFYDIINNPKELQSRLTDNCRGGADIVVRKTSPAITGQ